MDRLAKERKIIAQTSLGTIVLNFLLAVMKVITGILGNSTALISDAINSTSDVLTTVVVWISGKFSRKEIDDDHPYGHEKYESMISVFLGFALIITAFEIAKQSGGAVIGYLFNGNEITPPTAIALIAAAMTIGVKQIMFVFTKKNAKKASSPALMAMSLDHRSDQYAALGVFIGVGGAMLGVVILEPIASLVICVLIVKMAFRIIKIGFAQVVDQAADEESRTKIVQIATNFEGVVRLDDIKTRMFGLRMFVDLEIAVDHTLLMTDAHAIAQRLHDQIEAALPDVKHCMIHVNPDLECDNH
jgi:cation diffusion facilitator family transporter